MNIPLQISLHGIASSDALHNAIRERAEKLERYGGHLVSCRVVLELEARGKRHGRQFTCRIDLKVPGAELAVTHEHDEDVQVALREAFEAAKRRLVDYARERADAQRQGAARASEEAA